LSSLPPVLARLRSGLCESVGSLNVGRSVTELDADDLSMMNSAR